MNPGSTIRRMAKSCAVFVLGDASKPRRIIGGGSSGYRMILSPADNFGYLLGTADAPLHHAIRSYVSAGDTVYDVGAYMGYISLALSKQVGPHGRVAAFEPVPGNLRLLRENIRNNQLTNIQVLDVAASDRTGQAVLRLTENSSTGSMVWHKRDRSATEVPIQTVAIDELVESGTLEKPTFVKIDVEGAEGLALAGMQRTLASARPVVFLECSDAGRETTWPMLLQLDYHCQCALTGNPVTDFEKYRHSDFLWLPRQA